jgi:exosortase/archaeosortase family protein
MSAFALVLVLLQQSPGAIRALTPLDIVTAGVTATVLELSGMPVHQNGVVLSHPAGFSYEIYYNCTGLITALFLSIALLSLPGRWTSKVMRVFVGAGLVFALNFVRLVSLFYIGVWYPQVFGFFHAVLWNAGMLVFVFGFWLWSFHRTRSLNTPRKLSVREPRPSLNRLVT